MTIIEYNKPYGYQVVYNFVIVDTSCPFPSVSKHPEYHSDSSSGQVICSFLNVALILSGSSSFESL